MRDSLFWITRINLTIFFSLLAGAGNLKKCSNSTKNMQYVICTGGREYVLTSKTWKKTKKETCLFVWLNRAKIFHFTFENLMKWYRNQKFKCKLRIILAPLCVISFSVPILHNIYLIAFSYSQICKEKKSCAIRKRLVKNLINITLLKTWLT